MFRSTLFILSLCAFIQPSTYAVSPSSVKIKLYKMSVSTSELCTNPITVYENANPDYSDMAAGPTFGTVSLAEGQYPCVILEMSDYVKFSPEADIGSCNEGQEYTMEICRAGAGENVRLADGTTSTCADGEQHVAIWLSTTVVEDGDNNAFDAPVTVGDSANGFNLGSALSVVGSKTGTFVVDFTDKIEGSQGECGCDAPAFSFR